MEDFITIAQLAQGFHLSEKVIRHAFKKLLKQNKLIEGDDYIREGYRDELHFVYKIHPGRFAVHSNLFPTPPSVDNLATQFDTTGTHVDSKSATQGTVFDSKLDELDSKPATQIGSQDSNRAAREDIDTSPQGESSKGDGYLEKLFESKDEQVVNLKEHVSDLRSQLAKKDEQLALAQNMLASMQDGQDSARDLIKMLGERVIDLSRRELPSGTKMSNSGSNGSIQSDRFATQFDTTLDHLAAHDEQMGSNPATTPADEQSYHT
jgi:hypothetical protein